jgi:hypothetical protein
MIKNYQLLFVAFTLALSACTWVDLTQEGEKVKLLESSQVTQCKHLGQTTSTTKDKVAGVRRHDNAINYELTSLARNAAARMGGDSIVAESSEQNGTQTFLIYRCNAN